MKYNILLESAHNKDFKNIATSIFKLGSEEEGILHTVANNGPMVLTNISNKTENYSKWHCTRWAAKRWIDGTPKTLGLIPNEYLIEKNHEERIRGKDGNGAQRERSMLEDSRFERQSNISQPFNAGYRYRLKQPLGYSGCLLASWASWLLCLVWFPFVLFPLPLDVL